MPRRNVIEILLAEPVGPPGLCQGGQVGIEQH
jgi:hypothetical protein